METHIIDVDADIVEVDVPLLIDLDTLIELKILLDVSKEIITSTNKGLRISLTRKYGSVYIEWPNHIMFTVMELKKIQRHLFHT